MNASHTPRIDVMRSQLGRARGLGSAKTGVDHWWLERMSAVALAPLSGWFVLQVLRLAGSEQQDVVEWGGKPANASMLLALMVLTFYHMQLGLQVIIDDYVHGKAHLPASLLLKGAALLIGLFAVIAVLKLALAPSTKARA